MVPWNALGARRSVAPLAVRLPCGYRWGMNAAVKMGAPQAGATSAADPDDGLPRDEHGLTYREDNFARELVNTGNLQRAYRVAYHVPPHWSPDAVYKAGWRVRERPRVTERLKTLRAEADARTITTLVETVQWWHDIATADPSEVCRVEHYACRHCHGENGEYQWVDEREFAKALADTMLAVAKAERDGTPPPEYPTCDGGFGYTTQLEPSADCVRCFGHGLLRTFIEDTRRLSPKGRRLFKGVRETRNGIEVLLHDQSQARIEMAKLLGWLAGKGEAAIPASLTQQPKPTVDPKELSGEEAEKLYKSLLQ